MKTYLVTYQSINEPMKYSELVSAKDEKQAFKAAKSIKYKKDDRDMILSVVERNDLNDYDF